MRPFLFLGLLLLVSCGTKEESSKTAVKPGSTTRSELVALYGAPLEEKDIPVKNGKVLLFKNNFKYQLENDVVTNMFSTPTGSQTTLLFWKHKFKDCNSKMNKLPRDINSHTPGEVELACPEQGTSVIYTEGSDVVSRVISYEAK